MVDNDMKIVYSRYSSNFYEFFYKRKRKDKKQKAAIYYLKDTGAYKTQIIEIGPRENFLETTIEPYIVEIDPNDPAKLIVFEKHYYGRDHDNFDVDPRIKKFVDKNKDLILKMINDL